MTCPSCKNLMCAAGENFKCPICRGELFIPEKGEDLAEAWFRSQQKYPKAMRDMRKTSIELKRAQGQLRSWGAGREALDASLGFL
jgi:tRNA(Ile2) C34 agmatinyltransferase TiaS